MAEMQGLKAYEQKIAKDPTTPVLDLSLFQLEVLDRLVEIMKLNIDQVEATSPRLVQHACLKLRMKELTEMQKSRAFASLEEQGFVSINRGVRPHVLELNPSVVEQLPSYSMTTKLLKMGCLEQVEARKFADRAALAKQKQDLTEVTNK